MDDTSDTQDRPPTDVTRRQVIIGGAAVAGAMTLMGPLAPAVAQSARPTRPGDQRNKYLMSITDDPADTLNGIDYDYLTYPGVDLLMYNNGYNGVFGDEPILLGVRQRPEQHAMHDAEHHRRRTEA